MENLSPSKGDLIEVKNDVPQQSKILKRKLPGPQSPLKTKALDAPLCPHLPHQGAINAEFGLFSNAAHSILIFSRKKIFADVRDRKSVV